MHSCVDSTAMGLCCSTTRLLHKQQRAVDIEAMASAAGVADAVCTGALPSSGVSVDLICLQRLYALPALIAAAPWFCS
jgi:hypothetical protein